MFYSFFVNDPVGLRKLAEVGEQDVPPVPQENVVRFQVSNTNKEIIK